jgi:ABC-type glutathione transport system ATPase component
MGLVGTLVVVLSTNEANKMAISVRFAVSGLTTSAYCSSFASVQAAAIRRKNIKKGFSFTLMVVGKKEACLWQKEARFQFLAFVGASGLGKSTFVNTMCGKEVIPLKEEETPEKAAEEKTTQVTPHIVGKCSAGCAPQACGMR